LHPNGMPVTQKQITYLDLASDQPFVLGKRGCVELHRLHIAVKESQQLKHILYHLNRYSPLRRHR
jgi:hypothetical protein